MQSFGRVSDIPILPLMFGWPAVVAAIVLTSVGIARMRADFVLGGAFLAIPFLFYLFLSSFQWVVFAVGALLFGASRAVARGHSRAAWAMIAPFIGLAIFAAWGVVSQWAN
jgi:hypothetical protein